MSKMNQVIQIGEIEGKICYYIEDYVYTFLKKQENGDRKKYFLYGEKEETKDKTKLYIYGIGQKPKMEQTYFKEYYPLGFLRIKEDKKYWISLSGQENLITGFYVFYAPNQAMQEYLVDFHKEEKQEEKPTENTKKRFPTEMLPMKETAISARKLKFKNKKIQKEDKIPRVSFGGIFIALLLLMVLTTANGRNKLNIFKQVIKETMSGSVKMIPEEFIIEEKNIGEIENELVVQQELEEVRTGQEQLDKQETEIENEEETQIKQDQLDKQELEIGNEEGKIIKQEGVDKQKIDNRIDEKEVQAEVEKEVPNNIEEKKEDILEEPEYEEYIVKNGDTLVAICKKRYNSLLKMEEICKINKIKNADYIAPGQKLYLPR